MSESKEEDAWFERALELAKAAGRLVIDAWAAPRERSVLHTKASATDLVTETDQAVERLLIDGLSKSFPDHKFIGEESVAGGAKIEWTEAPTWIIDPIDGTTNFVHRIPHVAICIGLAARRELRFGIVYNPITGDLYTARVGRGAHKNGFPIRVSGIGVLRQSVVACSQGIHNIVNFGDKWLDIVHQNLRRLVEAGVHGNRSFGSAAINMVLVAEGALDAYVEYGIHAWDVAAAGVIVREAGGQLLDPTGATFDVMSRRVLVGSTRALCDQLSDLLTHVDYEPEA